ncbi:mitochondrial presequence protease [Spathaspora passalidarum NRRL Y-27907]|uniref:Presequence protease, mitochondrial n=1 Tax=Spathaspora passalidarum (strain NRRL Y-27907 / 11-Y1) TaxID=619300 RepID=G3ARC9_SPAPN|nr:mitochondrial presequence protease [Spathaspora passalidarum NRRL Y-27907]EGW31736.1 mitochondrial presequence protease [Spathaspora passalidarum NRRL Y-27907]
MLRRSGLNIHRTRQVIQRFLSGSTPDRAILSKYPIGLNLHGFEITETTPIPEFSLVAVGLQHPSGGKHLHLHAENDTNNVFSVAFKTNPPDSTGVPHILEHTTLCGSEKYPVRDPFFKMTNRSLSNFMNAMTGHDYTFYPFATTNAQDFNNLLDVYLSSVFEPRLNYNDFLQEGWRLEHEDVNDINSKITFKGVVYNEMKGQYSNSAYYFYIKFLESIYPQLHNSGGDPKNITDLNYEDLIEFHSKNYHPSNARSFTYGNLPLEGHLRKLNDFYTRFGKRSKSLDIKQPIFTQTNNKSFDIVAPGPIDAMSGKEPSSQYNSSITWNLGNPLDENMKYEVFKWKILGSLLFDGHNSPLYQELIESGYGEDFSPNSGVDITTSLFSLTVGLNFLTKEQAANLESKVVDIIKSKVLPELESPESNYDDRVQAIVHQIELNFKKHKANFGFGLLNAIVPSWVNGLDPIKQLQVDQTLTKFKEDYSQNGLNIFKDLINDTLLNPETKKFKFTMEPREDFPKVIAEEESTRLDLKTKSLEPEDVKTIYDRNLKLAEEQVKEQDTDVLPTLTMDDIPKRGEFYPLQNISINEKTVSERVVDTNGLVYTYALKSINNLPIKYHKYLPLFTNCLTNLAGTVSTPITDLETKINMKTGGISFNYRITPNPYNTSDFKLGFSISGLALKKDAKHVYDLWYEIITQTKLEAEEDVLDKLSVLIKNMAQNQINNIADRGHSYASGVSSSKLSPSKYVSDLTNGLTQIQFVSELNSNLESRGEEFLTSELLPILQEIQQHILYGEPEGFKYRLVGDAEIVKENELLLQDFDSKLAKNSLPSTNEGLDSLLSSWKGLTASEKTLVNLPYQVGYSSLAKQGANYASKDGAALQVLSQLYTFKHLHSKIRESNGAYGGGLNYDGLSGILNYYSYRDPNPVKSIETFTESFDYGLKGWTDADLQQAKLRIFQSVDAPINVSSQGSSVFFDGISDELRQERRENFLSVNSNDLVDAAQKYLVDSDINSITIIGDNDALKVGDDWKVRELKA